MESFPDTSADPKESKRGSPDHPETVYVKEKGCVKDINIEPGGQMRVTLDRDSPLYHVVYCQRTCASSINSQAKEPGSEHPKVRNGRSVEHLNTLTSIVIYVQVLKRAKSINRGFLQMN